MEKLHCIPDFLHFTIHNFLFPAFNTTDAGKLVKNGIGWRGDSGLLDGEDANLDLSKGMFDAGDLIKFGFPMAFTATVLSWAILEYGDRMNAVKQLGYGQESLTWITNFLINAHPSANVLYIQVGDPEVDHGCWERPETMTEEGSLTQINISYPRSDAAAAMASASLIFKKINSSYFDLLLMHAKQLFNFSDTYRGSYSISVPQVQKYYNSTGYGDELLWAAAWLYHATKEQSYVEYITKQHGQAFVDWGSPTWFNWDDKHAATPVLLSRINLLGANETSIPENLDLQIYRETAEAIICSLLPNSPTATSNRTKSGLIWITQWNSLQHPVASAY
ncbi:hypothetical protein SLA2020_184710 [Shorea laevis]